MRALPGVDENDFARWFGRVAGHGCVGEAGQGRSELAVVPADHHGAVVEPGSRGGQRVADVNNRCLVGDVLGEPPSLGAEGFGSFGG